MGEYLFEKKVDQSLLKYGLTIPVNMIDKVQKAIGVQLAKGQGTSIKIILENRYYDANLGNIKFSDPKDNRMVFQIRYSAESPICQKLKSLFPSTDPALLKEKEDYIEVYSVQEGVLEFRVKNDVKEALLKYIGPKDSLAGYQRSYKLVFYKVFFKRLLENSGTYWDDITSDFQQFYVERKKAGLDPDYDADDVIVNIDNSTLTQVYNLILRNPFNAITSHGFVLKEPGERERFVLSQDLNNQLSTKDYQSILELVDQKLKLYFSSMGKPKNEGGDMREIIERILNEYVSAKSETFAGHPLGSFYRNDIPRKIYSTGLVDSNDYLITGSVGQGNWAMIPWVCIFDRSITTTATKGVYIVYLLKKDGTSLYLTFNQGCTDIRNSHSKRETISIMRQKAAEIVSQIDSRGFNSDQDINLGDGLTELGELYQKGAIFYKEYHKGAVPNEKELQDDLKKMMDIYQEYANRSAEQENEGQIGSSDEESGEAELTVGEIIDQIKRYIETKGFSYQDGLIENFYLSLKSKPFVILAGTSGTGKTRLVKLFSEAIGAEYKMIPVRPDWSDSSDLFGHLNLNGEFIPGAVLNYISDAQNNPERPYILCLDEMNLARVEYYLSDFLSVIETRELRAGVVVSDPLMSSEKYGSDKDAYEKYGELGFPQNLYIVGTVNMDETTFPFSKKVLDRANTIEFNYVDLVPKEAVIDHEERLELKNDFLVSKYVFLSQCQDDTVSDICKRLQAVNEVLRTANAHVGYRVRDEIVFYMLNNKNAGLLQEQDALDFEIMQKILPRIQGSSSSVKNMLCELFKIFAGDYDGYQTQSDDTASKMMKKLQDGNAVYPRSAEKIAFMVRRFEEDGFTSYWL